MTDLSNRPADTAVANTRQIRFVTAASLFDGHDASINIMRRILQQTGVEVIHLGHNRSVQEVVNAAVQEDVHGLAVSSYQGGHVEYFKYMIDLLKERGGENIKVFGGGGGVIIGSEINELQSYGVERIYSPEDGARMGLVGMIEDMIARSRDDLSTKAPSDLSAVLSGDQRALARLITGLEAGSLPESLRKQVMSTASTKKSVPVLGVTGTGGSGKSSLTDELIRRFRLDLDDRLKIAIIAVDPTRRKTGGALLGDRIRMNAIEGDRIFMRSLATKGGGVEIAPCLPEVIAACKCAGYDLIVVETSGIGQGDAAIVPHVDVSLYVMTPEYGAASQLEKIDMLDFANFVAINKFDRKGALDALRDVSKQFQRNQSDFTKGPDQMPVFGTMAARFNDDGVTALYHKLLHKLAEKGLQPGASRLPLQNTRHSTNQTPIVPPARTRYLAEISDTVRGYKRHAAEQSTVARERQQLLAAKHLLQKECQEDNANLLTLAKTRDERLTGESRKLLDQWPDLQKAYSGDEYVVKIRDKEIRSKLTSQSLSGTPIRKVALPHYEDHGEQLKWLMLENVPGSFPFTGGVFAFKRENEDPTRMFAGEGDPFRTNKRFHLLAADMPAKRLSTAFDSVTLYGFRSRSSS